MKRITVKKLPNNNYRVGNKIVYQDLDGCLIAVTELTTKEKEAFYKYIASNSIK